MKTEKNLKQDALVVGIIISLIGLMLLIVIAENKEKYVYYNVPTYTTVYEIVYPDTTYRYTAVHHSPSRLSSHKGSNFLYSKHHYRDPFFDRERPDYWVDEWNNSELSVETTAPIRLVSETVTYKQVKYRKYIHNTTKAVNEYEKVNAQQ